MTKLKGKRKLFKVYTQDEMKDEYIGKKGTPARDKFEDKLAKAVKRNRKGK